MKVGVKLQGTSFARAQLATVNRKVDPVLRGALNTTATSTRREEYATPLLKAFRTRAFLNAKLKIKRARSRRMEARIIPSSSGIRVSAYRGWSYEAISATRARVFVTGPNGKKLAAGFVNPSSAGKKPLYNQSRRGKYVYSRRLQEAIGPSIAYWFKQLSTAQLRRRTGAFLQREFERRLRAEIAKGIR